VHKEQSAIDLAGARAARFFAKFAGPIPSTLIFVVDKWGDERRRP
jgi:hypothetical protein